MILSYGDTSRLAGRDWYMLELRSERTGEETCKRLGKILPQTFQNDPAEVFLPIQKRDLGTFELMTECYIFVRSLDPAKVGKLRHITGIVQVLADDEIQRPNKFIPIEDAYVQGLIAECESKHLQRPHSIKLDSFVRILDGHTRDFCGYVIAISNGCACVRVDMKTKIVIVETPLQNLLDLSHVPENHRVFYYSGPVAEFFLDDDEIATEEIDKDRVFAKEEETIVDMSEFEGAQPMKHTRQQTVTAYIRKLIYDGARDPKVVVEAVAKALDQKQLRAPKNLMILWNVVKTAFLELVFKDDPDIKDYTDVLKKHGSSYKIGMKTLQALFPTLHTQAKGRNSRITTISIQVTDPNPRIKLNTISTLTRELLDSGETDMWVVVTKIADAIRDKSVRAPKHAGILLHVVKEQVLSRAKAQDPSIKTYSDVVAKFGSAYRVTETRLLEYAPWLGAYTKAEVSLPTWVQQSRVEPS